MTSDTDTGLRWLFGAMAAMALIAAAAWWWDASAARTAAAVPVHAKLAAAAPAAPAAPHATAEGQIDNVVQALAQRLQRQPGDAEGWAMLARSYAALGRHADALPAYRRALDLRGGDPALMADYADALALQQDRRLAGEPMQWITRALAIDPTQPKALLLAGTEAFDRGDYPQAVAHWTRVVELAPPASGLVAIAQAGLAEARQRMAPARPGFARTS